MDHSVNKPSFVTAFNRDRDNYQVALALAEAGMLETLVTDFYASPLRAKLLPSLKHRRIEGVAPEHTRSSPIAVLLQAIGPMLGRDVHETLAHTHRVLGAKARAEARRTRADLLLYSEHALEAFTDAKLQDRRRILFSFHPHRRLTEEIIAADTERFPEIAWAFHDERPSPSREARENEELTKAQLVLCASSFTKESLLRAGVPAEKISVVPYGTSAREVTTADRTSQECRFLFVGQGVQRKGLHHLLRVWDKLALPNATLTLVCYRIDPALVRLGEPNVEVLSGLPREKLDAVFARSHVFVGPSLAEGFGLVFLEAMAAGCYVIGTKNTGLPDLEVPAELASIFDAGDLDSLADSLVAAYERHQRGGIPHDEIAKFSETRSWTLFRDGLRKTVLEFAARTL